MGAGGGWAVAAQGVTDIGKTVAAGVAQLQAQKFTKKMMKNRFQWMVDDLRAAGLNPILAVRGGLSPQMGGSGIASIPGGGSIGSTALSAAKFKSEIAVLTQQAESLASSAAKDRSQALLNLERTKEVRLHVDEFRPTVGGVGRRIFESERVQKFIKKVGPAMRDWVKERMQNAAERSGRGRGFRFE